MEIDVKTSDFNAIRSLLESAANEILDNRYVDSMSGAIEIESLISLCESFFKIEDLLIRFHESTGCVSLVSEDIRAKYDFAQSIR